MSIVELIISGSLFACGILATLCKLQKEKNQRLTKQNESLKQRNAIAESQLKYHKERRKNEENSRELNRDQLIDRLQSNTDLRD